MAELSRRQACRERSCYPAGCSDAGLVRGRRAELKGTVQGGCHQGQACEIRVVAVQSGGPKLVFVVDPAASLPRTYLG